VINKIIAAAAVAGALSVPLAAVAMANPNQDTTPGPGVGPGHDGNVSGQSVRLNAQQPGSKTAGLYRDSGGGYKSPGQMVKTVSHSDLNPGHK
jgi:hypothetical protein